MIQWVQKPPSVNIRRGCRRSRRVFHGCRSLTSRDLPQGLQRIESCAFLGCTSLTSVTLPEGLREVGGSAFSLCGNLTSLTFHHHTHIPLVRLPTQLILVQKCRTHFFSPFSVC